MKGDRTDGRTVGQSHLTAPIIRLSDWPTVRLPPRVVLLVHPLQVGPVHVGIELGGADASMAQERLDHPQIGATFEQMGGKTVPKRVRGDLGTDPRRLAPTPHEPPRHSSDRQRSCTCFRWRPKNKSPSMNISWQKFLPGTITT